MNCIPLLASELLKGEFAEGSALGGARPKATVRDDERMLWLVKFPSRNDSLAVPVIETATLRLAAKAGLTVLLDGVRNRVDRHGVHVLTIKPGFVATPMTAHLPRGPLFAQPVAIGRGILDAIESRKDTVYLPGFWRLILLIIRALPSPVMHRTGL